MRLLAVTVLIGSGWWVAGLKAQNANSTAPAKTADTSSKGKKAYGTSRTDALTEGAPERRLTPAEMRNLQGGSQDSREEPAEAAPAPKSTAPAASNFPTVARVPEVPAGHPTAQQVASVKTGSSEKEMTAALGAPGSCLTLPDEGHLRKTCKYFSASGVLVGTIRLDNSKVVQVDAAH